MVGVVPQTLQVDFVIEAGLPTSFLSKSLGLLTDPQVARRLPWFQPLRLVLDADSWIETKDESGSPVEAPKPVGQVLGLWWVG